MKPFTSHADSDKPQRAEAQPWHAADEKRPGAKKDSVPAGTHSLTGGGADVGMPLPPQADAQAERGRPGGAAREPDPLAEPRANIGEILGHKP